MIILSCYKKLQLITFLFSYIREKFGSIAVVYLELRAESQASCLLNIVYLTACALSGHDDVALFE